MPHLQDFSSLLTEAFHIGLRQGRALHQRLDLPLQLFVMRLHRRLPHILAHLKLCSSTNSCQTPEQPPNWPKMAEIGVPKMALRWACTGWLRIPLPCFQKDFLRCWMATRVLEDGYFLTLSLWRWELVWMGNWDSDVTVRLLLRYAFKSWPTHYSWNGSCSLWPCRACCQEHGSLIEKTCLDWPGVAACT